ncbi:MAG: hypothetical protein AUJ57_05900 [Zetaproteobacteria bacterium CG1_02_53_45]|nr:MAG: hypothetical protein AUJ57_05900 [Zetaproteobacteria bacterium CG1_02_53_45]
MSYILDALRKSEEKRSNLNVSQQLQAIIAQPESRKRRLALPLFILTGALIAIALLSRIYTMQPVVADHQAQAPVGDNPAITLAVTEPEMPPLEAPSSIEAAPVSEPASAPVQAGEKLPEIAPVTPISDAPSGVEQVAKTNIPSRYELPVTVQNALPEIKIEGHIYDSDPARRMVFVNGSVRKEKQSIAKNLTLEEITPNGVILSYQGSLFHIGLFEP